MKKIILIIIMLSLFTVCLSNDAGEDEKIASILKSLEQRIGMLEKKIAETKIAVEGKQYKNTVIAEDMAVLAESDIKLKDDIDNFQLELETLEQSIKKK